MDKPGGAGLVEQRRQRMANGVSHVGGDPKHAGPRHSLRKHRQKEMGRQLCLHGSLRFCGGCYLLGYLGLQDVLRGEAAAVLGQGWAGAGPEVSHKAGGPPRHAALLQQRRVGDGGDRTLLPHGYYGLVPVRVRSHCSRHLGWLRSGSDELQGLDDVRAALAHFLLHHRRLQLVGRRLLVPLGVIDYSGGYVIHLSSGIAGFTAAYWVSSLLTFLSCACMHIINCIASTH